MLMKLHNRQTGSDRQMQAASREINEICERLRLPDVVKNSALEVFKDVSAGQWSLPGFRLAGWGVLSLVWVPLGQSALPHETCIVLRASACDCMSTFCKMCGRHRPHESA